LALKIAVGLGLFDLPFASASGWWHWVDLCEAGGIDSIWQSDRLTGRSPALECLSTMAALAGRTRRLKFGMNVLSMGLRDPVLVARQCATIDFLSGGRLLPGFGIGSARSPDWQALGVEAAGRGARADEGLEIVSRLWREDEVTFLGRYHQLRGVSIAPKPVQSELPMWIGGASDAAIRRAARFGTGWQGGFETPEEAGRLVEAIQEQARRLDRIIDPDHFGIGLAVRVGRPDEPVAVRAIEHFAARSGDRSSRGIVVGDAADIVARMAGYRRFGVSKFVIRPVVLDEDDMLVQTRLLVDHVLPRVAELNRGDAVPPPAQPTPGTR
jgi:probable F420-dependent oxidoreductase